MSFSYLKFHQVTTVSCHVFLGTSWLLVICFFDLFFVFVFTFRFQTVFLFSTFSLYWDLSDFFFQAQAGIMGFRGEDLRNQGHAHVISHHVKATLSAGLITLDITLITEVVFIRFHNCKSTLPTKSLLISCSSFVSSQKCYTCLKKISWKFSFCYLLE